MTGHPQRFSPIPFVPALAPVLMLVLTTPPVARAEPRPAEDQSVGNPDLTLEGFAGVIHKMATSSLANRPLRLLDRNNPDTLFRLGELYEEKVWYHNWSAHGLDEKILAVPAASRPALQEQRRVQAREAEKYRLEAVKAYTAAAKDSSYARRDEVLLRLGALFASTRDEAQAREVLSHLFRDYPRSKRLPEMYLRLAELSFDNGDLRAAIDLYAKVESFPTSDVYPFAVYKMGWCRLKLGEAQAAFETFVALALMTEEGEGDGGSEKALNLSKSKRRSLAKEAKKGLVKAYARAGAPPQEAAAFFEKVGGGDAPKMKQALADLYRKEGKVEAANALLDPVDAQTAVKDGSAP